MTTGPVVAGMQPYLFPYLGYFQLIHRADLFVVADDFPWVDRGWINRNRILDRGEVAMVTIPVSRRRDPIAAATVTAAYPAVRTEALRRLRQAYARAAHRDVLDLVEQWLDPDAHRLVDLVTGAMAGVCDYLGIPTPRVLSSSRPVTDVRGADRAVAVVRAWQGSGMLNPPGGRSLYRPETFAAAGLSLRFLEPDLPPYRQVGRGEFVPGLSILDVIANVDRAEAARMATLGRAVAA